MKEFSTQYKKTLLKRGSLRAIFDKYYNDIPENIKIQMRKESGILEWTEEGNQPSIRVFKVLFQHLKEKINSEKQEALEMEIQKAIRKVDRSFPLEDINMPNTKIESIRNKVAEEMAHGLNAREILKDLTLITRPELVRVIMDLIENPVAVNGGSNKEPLTPAEVGTILFALRHLEVTMKDSGYTESEHMVGLEPLNEMQLNKLCEDLNFDRKSF